ncbi:MAG: hypothetical protein B7Y47_04890 [Sphingomonas sp. 28-63-12]|nr:MAG: hypothetical protein B7Y47_04890 [Sphingomonas sp. 28-63-12]
MGLVHNDEADLGGEFQESQAVSLAPCMQFCKPGYENSIGHVVRRWRAGTPKATHFQVAIA